MAGHPEDDPSIPDSEDLWRRITPDWIVDGQDGPRVTSQAFQNGDDGAMSVHLSSVAAKIGRTPESILQQYPGYSLARLTAGDARAVNQGVKPDPTEADPDHGAVVGNKTKGVRRHLSGAAKLIASPR